MTQKDKIYVYLISNYVFITLLLSMPMEMAVTYLNTVPSTVEWSPVSLFPEPWCHSSAEQILDVATLPIGQNQPFTSHRVQSQMLWQHYHPLFISFNHASQHDTIHANHPSRNLSPSLIKRLSSEHTDLNVATVYA
jgi:hypothetical protein